VLWRLERIAAGLNEAATRRFATRTTRLPADAHYISFSFDDCPLSATTTGRDILEAAGARGTFYLAGGLADAPGLNPVSFEAGSVPDLRAAGHEIACHTYGHVRAPDLTAASLAADLTRNTAWLEGALPGYRAESFSYPYGATSLAVKRVVGRHYRNARSTLEGINSGSIDLLLLKATRIYERLGNLPHLLEQIAKVRDEGGWLIFYTHDVEEPPSPYGCTPRMFRQLVEASVASGCNVLPVRDVVRSIAPEHASAA